MLEKIINCQIEITNTIKLLIYDFDKSIIEKLDLDDDQIFLEPLLFTYFNFKSIKHYSSDFLSELIQGYFVEKKTNFAIMDSFNKNDIAYIPNAGYFKKNADTPFEEIKLLDGTKIEILNYPVNLLNDIFFSIKENSINFEEIIIDTQILEKNIDYLTRALNLIKNNSNEHFLIIEQCCKKILLFKTNPEITNSFATINAHGTAFLNVYQDNYKVVFFIDDIAHQTGHIILTTLFYNRKNIFKIDENLNIGEILNKNDYRNFYTLFHALYTYYTTFICLDDCLKNNVLDEEEKAEAIGRIGFYINKCSIDLENFDKFVLYYRGIENVLNESAIKIYNMINTKYFEISNKWNHITSKSNYINQTYNFRFDIFVQNNK
jgi:hypothetical protein